MATPPPGARPGLVEHRNPEPAAPVTGTPGPTEGFVTLEAGTFYRIPHVERMRPFLMTLASDTDLWMFVTSGGGLTAGRRDPDGAVFPYETVDRLEDGHHHTGPITLLRVRRAGVPPESWQPFADPAAVAPGAERHLYKNVLGNRLVFEEIHRGLGLALRARWAGCDALGWVRTVTLENRSDRPVSVDVLDGLRNLLPHGVPLALYQHSSCLVDAYKRADRAPDAPLVTYALTARLTDRAEALEALRANVAWCAGRPEFDLCLSADAVPAFRRGETPRGERTLPGRRGCLLATGTLELAPGARATWHMAADAGVDHARVAELRAMLRSGGDLDATIETHLAAADEALARNVGGADGLQLTGDPIASAHHFANVLFNNMRGGVFPHGGRIPVSDLAAFVESRNRDVAARRRDWLAALPDGIPVDALLARAADTGDADLERLCLEYLPLSFGRRHGDPSRPWNRFSIRTRHADGSPALHYEGNWRDIFQNWEALALSFPGFLPGMVAKFVNASTLDGFNPYRITRDGVDWEVPEPDHPWNNIGYWGDHQVVYLQRLLEALDRTAPGTLERLLPRALFSYADVPYRLRPWDAIVSDPRHTIDFDRAHAARVAARVNAIGADGRLVPDPGGGVRHVSLAEKLLVTALGRLSHFVPGGGIWMNTQRPEWNDANNALVGNGVSVVTLFQLRRQLAFLAGLFERPDAGDAPVSEAVATWMRRVGDALAAERATLAGGGVDDAARMRLLSALGRAFSDHRATVYAAGPGAAGTLPAAAIAAFCREALAHVEHALRANRRPDGLYHAYLLLTISQDRARAALRPLPEMLEGQVAALASGFVPPAEAPRMVDALYASHLYRADQDSFLLYPVRELPAFLEKNVIPAADAGAVPLLRALVASRDTSVIVRDSDGVHRFAGDLRNAADLAAALDRLAADPARRDAVARDRAAVLGLFEAVFHHHAFTGRSGAMYAYEGIGCIYWHMVAKLLLAVQELALEAQHDGAPDAVREDLAQAYARIRAGLGFTKSAAAYGAFPTDPYSHTPMHAGAQQPGMTGQVKEEVLARFGELGVTVEDGRVQFRPALLRRSELRAEPGTFRLHDAAGRAHGIALPAGALGFTMCGVPVLYVVSRGGAWIRVTRADGAAAMLEGDRLDAAASAALFARDGSIARIDVGVPEAALRD